jgi:RNA polymerase sigma-70 factor (ECF subfamily)
MGRQEIGGGFLTREEEIRIVRKVLAGDVNAFEQLVIENQKSVYNLALKIMKNESDALDVSQDVFLKAYTNLENFRGDSRFSVWLYRLAYNACIDASRKSKAGMNVSLTVQDEDSESAELDLADTKPLPEEETERRETQREVQAAIQELPEEQRRIIVMREFSDMAYEDIASALGISVGTVKSRLSRARKNLAKILIQNGTISPPKRHK